MDIFLFYLTKKVVDNGIEIWYSGIVNKGGLRNEENIYSKENKFTKTQQNK